MDLVHRPRRLRQTPALRRLTRETRLHPAELIAPLFVEAGRGIHTPLASMPGQFRFSVDTVVEEGKRLERLGVGGVILFGIPARKDARGASGWDPDGPVPQALAALKVACPGLVLMADVCLCEHRTTACGILHATGARRDRRGQRRDAAAPRAGSGVLRARGRRRRRAERAMMDGRSRRSARGSTRPGSATRRSSRTRRSRRRRSTGRSATPRAARRARATARATRWTRRTGARRCARRCSTSRRARTR
jgi:porphobilinogen synthase